MLTQTFVIVCIFSTVNSWVLRSSENIVALKLSKNVTIECHNDAYGTNDQMISSVYRMRIKRFNDKEEWDTVAEIGNSNSNVKTSLVDATASGLIDEINNSYIRIEFETASEETVGEFICEVDGVDYQRQFKVINTKSIVIRERSIYDGLMEILRELKEEERENYGDLNGTVTDLSIALSRLTDRVEVVDKKHTIVTETAIGKVNERISGVDTDILELQKSLDACTKMNSTLLESIETLTNQISTINENLSSITKTQKKSTENLRKIDPMDPSVSWPVGLYTFLKPNTGCPFPFTSTWEMSSVTISTKPGNQNKDSSSKDLNLFGKVFQHHKDLNSDNNYVYLPMCSKISDGQAPQWPKGSYCIQLYILVWFTDDRECPSGFHYGYTHYGRYDNGNVDVVFNLPGYYKSNKHTVTLYCCRNDGEPRNPLVLPRQQPFILYRFGGECQQVKGMTSSNQWISLDVGTGENDNFNSNDNHPDGVISNKEYRIEFCYYTPSA